MTRSRTPEDRGANRLSEGKPVVPLSEELLRIDPAAETDRIVGWMRGIVGPQLRKRGAVVGISGGIDSSVCLALCVRAFGRDNVISVTMPEHDSSPASERLAKELAEHFGVSCIVEDMSPALSGLGAYLRRDRAIQRIFPEYQASYKAKIILPSALGARDELNVFRLTIIPPEGEAKTKRVPLRDFLEIVAASNFKQRSRMAMLYYHAERLNYAVIGTGNKNEHDQGFFVKYGDGGSDIRPLAHLFKTQVFRMAAHLGIPKEIRERVPTTDTYTAECTQEEFFFRVPFEIGDVIWSAMERNIPIAELAKQLGLSVEQVTHIQNDIRRKIQATAYLRAEPQRLD
jgi:NAD+ synthase